MRRADLEVRVRYTKWGGRRHWEFAVDPLGSDGFGWWLGGRTGSQVRRGDEEPILQPYDHVMLVPASGSWLAFWNRPPSETELYIDVTTTPVSTPDLITAVDLDLDVARHWDGRVELLDEDEFAEHQVRYGYPPAVIEQAVATAAELVAAVTAGAEPFGTVGAGWLDRFTADGITGGAAAGRP